MSSSGGERHLVDIFHTIIFTAAKLDLLERVLELKPGFY